MLGVPSQDSGWNRIVKSESRAVFGSISEGSADMQCAFSDGRNSATPSGGISNYTGSAFAPQLAKSSSAFDIGALSGSGPSMSSTAGPNFGVDAFSPKLKCAGQVSSQEKASAVQPLSQSVTGLPNSVSSLPNVLPPRPNSAKFGVVKASSSLYPRPREEDRDVKKDEVASAEPEPSALWPSTPCETPGPGELSSVQNWQRGSQNLQPSSQPGQGYGHEQSDQAAEPSDGEVVYLGAGLYGRHTEQKVPPTGPKKPQKKERQKVLPGRVAPLPPKLVARAPPRPAGPLQGAGEQILLPPRSMKLEATDRIAASMREQRAASAKRARSQDSFAAPAFGSSAPGRMGQGNSAPPSSRLAPGAPVPLPNACEDREKKRFENKEARRQARQSLETPDCQTGRLSQECYTGRLSHTSSAPSLRAYAKPAPIVDAEVAAPTAEDIEKQKMRLACKMEILGFYDGYRSALGKMTKDQNKKLASKLTSADKEVVTDTVKQLNKDRQTQLDEWSQKTENQKSVHRRLKLINEFYTDTFNAQTD
eukprot:gnl/MRDRNA2_/MRDRNA2_96356_c0_seq1.p1 gnl/MRDRNA2_/MRDRNA2_96356_c0~~gnl/MRDRNA2_/MRDRNA2_96356_c0_seq1.p1  ORF type:complete len:618 (-),score=110.71 gnl/MRDRNA2_/MRDRNA2_96356_c0_seq1:27-1628(-)